MDGPAKVTGKALYVDDLGAPGLLYGATVRSEVPRGRLLALVPDLATNQKTQFQAAADDAIRSLTLNGAPRA